MSSRRQAVDKLDRTITRLYTYLSGSEGEDTEPNATTSLNQHHRSTGNFFFTDSTILVSRLYYGHIQLIAGHLQRLNNFTD